MKKSFSFMKHKSKICNSKFRSTREDLNNFTQLWNNTKMNYGNQSKNLSSKNNKSTNSNLLFLVLKHVWIQPMLTIQEIQKINVSVRMGIKIADQEIVVIKEIVIQGNFYPQQIFNNFRILSNKWKNVYKRIIGKGKNLCLKFPK